MNVPDDMDSSEGPRVVADVDVRSHSVEREPVSTALLVVDMQNDFVALDGARSALGADTSATRAAVGPINRLLGGARSVGISVIFACLTNSDRSVSEVKQVVTRAAGRDPLALCRKGSWGAELFAEIERAPDDQFIEKHRYSAFFGTSLDLLLRASNIRTLVVAGTETNVCVESTVRDAYMHDYHVVVARDAVGHVDQDLAEASLDTMSRYFGTVCSTDDLLSSWKPFSSAPHRCVATGQ